MRLTRARAASSRALGHVSRARIARERCARGWRTRARTWTGVARACDGVAGEKRGGWCAFDGA